MARWRTSIAAVSETAGKVTVRVPAKINLRLAVGPPRPDGFHEIATVFHAVDLVDVLTATAAGSLTLTLNGPQRAGLPADRHNLAWRAAELLATHAGIAGHVELAIDKNIPVSADAAAALLACDRLWGLALPAAELTRLAARLGSDVAFALLGGSALGTGRGEQLRPIAGGARFHWVLAAADGALGTPAVYAELDLASGDPERLAAELANDLQPAAIALAPYLAATLAAGRDGGALAGIVSGSGPTCAFLARDAEHARTLADTLRAGGSCRRAYPVVGGSARAMVE